MSRRPSRTLENQPIVATLHLSVCRLVVSSCWGSWLAPRRRCGVVPHGVPEDRQPSRAPAREWQVRRRWVPVFRLARERCAGPSAVTILVKVPAAESLEPALYRHGGHIAATTLSLAAFSHSSQGGTSWKLGIRRHRRSVPKYSAAALAPECEPTPGDH